MSPSPSEKAPYSALDRVFHEPSRLAILSALLGAARGLSFSELKSVCDLTDGNLSRHLKTLSETRVLEIDKQFVRNRPRTTVRLSKRGRARFLQYLEALERVLQDAARRAAKVDESYPERAEPLGARYRPA